MIEPRLLEILRCPVTGQRLRMVSTEDLAGEEFLETEDGRIRYPVDGSMPMLTREDARERGHPVRHLHQE